MRLCQKQEPEARKKKCFRAQKKNAEFAPPIPSSLLEGTPGGGHRPSLLLVVVVVGLKGRVSVGDGCSATKHDGRRQVHMLT